jgi:hypothetical protein
MGAFKIEIEAAGGHGCQREVKDGGTVYGCGSVHCPDCLAREFVALLKNKGYPIDKATFTHWPGQPEQVQDDLLTRVRKGSF